MTDELDSASDANLNEIFHREVFLQPHRHPRSPWATSADAMLPWLSGYRVYDWHISPEERERLNGGVCVALANGCRVYAPTFARAACIAVIRDVRAERIKIA